MPLPDKHPGVVDRFSHTSLEYKSLKAAFKEVLHRQGQDIIKLVLALIQKPISIHPAKKSLTLKNPTWVLLIKGQKIPSSISYAAQSILNSPELPLASQPVLSHQLQLSIQSLLFIRTTRLLKCLPICNHS